ncbi:MAG: matrixin family metalloprotease [Nitrosarchaeum sp.]|nr:matrixin family metalloprotease [Nitrosarchaeum sp.]
MEQTKKFLEKSILREEQKNKKLSKKNISIIVGAAITIATITTGYSILVVDLVGQQYQMTNLGEIKSNYVVQNLKGDTIDTWLSWRLVDGSIINVNLIDGQKYPDKVDIVKSVILSEEAIEIDNSLLHKGPKGTTSTYYVGWAGALASTSTPSEFYIPQKFNIIESSRGEGDITIKLTSQSSGDGYSGFTKSIADDAQNQILKSEITIYEVDKLSKAQFETILRHEFGHALGLAHSTAPEDLMHPTIETNYPYISDCDIDAIVSLYDGGKKSEVTCEN